MLADERFRDRRDAGRRLGELVASALQDETAGPDRAGTAAAPPVVLGLARGGLPVAAEVARRLGAPLDVIIARKLGVPWQPELGMGAIAEGGGRMLNRALVADLGLDARSVEGVTARETVELERRVRRYRGDRAPLAVAGRTVVLVDDGLATGYTARAAIDAVRRRGAGRVVLAVPVAPAESAAELAGIADRVVVVEQPDPFMAIGAFYEDFDQVTDDEVSAILDAGGPHPAGADEPPARVR
jgi:putative phosphoribosyl transferase